MIKKLFAIFLVVFCLNACTEAESLDQEDLLFLSEDFDPDDGSNNNLPDGLPDFLASAIIDGEQSFFYSSIPGSTSAQFFGFGDVNAYNLTVLNSSSSIAEATETLIIQINEEDFAEGTYELGSSVLAGFGETTIVFTNLTEIDAGLAQVTNSGSLTITTLDTQNRFVQGTFNANVDVTRNLIEIQDSFAITNGTFHFTY